MYDELIKRLRNCATQAAPCKTCGMTEDGSCSDTLMKHAADAIEELQQIAAHYEETAHDYFKDVCYYLERVPKWIPVTERLPEQKKAHYLCLLDDDSMAVVYWSKVPDWVSKGEWAWHNPNWKDVTHWMPLPEPPKEKK